MLSVGLSIKYSENQINFCIFTNLNIIIKDYFKGNVLLLNQFIALIFLVTIAACSQHSQPVEDTKISLQEQYVNPAASGFDSVNSDAEAIKIADLVMDAMGGRSAWDNTRYLAWDFFGARKLIWDKEEHQVRIDFPDSSVSVVNVKDLSGRVWKQGEEITNLDSLSKYLNRAKNIWINDSYWLVMPFKLKDSGVTLKYITIDETESGDVSYVLEMTFAGVGVTPQNKYLVYVDTASNLVNQWAYYRDFEQDTANFVLPWGNYKNFGKILLSDERGERDLSDVFVFEDLPEEVFTSMKTVELGIYQ